MFGIVFRFIVVVPVGCIIDLFVIAVVVGFGCLMLRDGLLFCLLFDCLWWLFVC